MRYRLQHLVVLLAFLWLGPLSEARVCSDGDFDGFFLQPDCGTPVDCNDWDAAISPSATDDCNGIDDDCDGLVDELCETPCESMDLLLTDPFVDHERAQWNSGVAWNGEEYGVVFLDDRVMGNDRFDSYFVRVSAEGVPFGGEVQLTTGGNSVLLAAEPIVWGGNSYAVIADRRRFRLVKPETGVAFERSFDGMEILNVAWDGQGWGLVYQESSSSNRDTIWFERLDPNGWSLGPPTRVPSTNSEYTDLGAPWVTWNGSGYVVVWRGRVVLEGGNGPLLTHATRFDAAGQWIGDVTLNLGQDLYSPILRWTGDRYLLLTTRRAWTISPGLQTVTDLGGFSVGEYGWRAQWTGTEWVHVAHVIDDNYKLAGQRRDVDFQLVASSPGFVQYYGHWSWAWTGKEFGVAVRRVRDLTFYILSCDCTDEDGDGETHCRDCDDTNPEVKSHGPPVCDGLNNDCADPAWPALTGTEEADDDDDGFSECIGDCDDERIDVYPGAPQVCDGRNNDCDHPSWPSTLLTNERDDDGDSFAECGGDCDDTQVTVYPGAAQVCDGWNNDCQDLSWPLPPASDRDLDGDGFRACTECDDGDPTRYPGAPESCNGIDDDCDGLIDDDADGEDTDTDGWHNACDNCPLAFNSSQADFDFDGAGNSCDNCLLTSNPAQMDTDFDAVGDACDNCPTESNPAQSDLDEDSFGDVCDNCVLLPNPEQSNSDSDFLGDACDNCPELENRFQEDEDADDVGDACDNCTFDPNPSQSDLDLDRVGDSCDNCVDLANPGQSDMNQDDVGDVCDLGDGLIYVLWSGVSNVNWQPELGYDLWNLYRGDLGIVISGGPYTQVPGSNPTALSTCGSSEVEGIDDWVPAPGVVAHYLVGGVAGGVEGDLGTTSAGAPRPNDSPCVPD